MTIGRDQEGVLNSDSPAAGKVHPWLNGDRCIGAQPTFGSRPDHRGLVDVEANTVSQPMTEVLAMACGLNDRSGSSIEVSKVDA